MNGIIARLKKRMAGQSHHPSAEEPAFWPPHGPVASIVFGSSGNDANHLGIGWLQGETDCRWAAGDGSEIWLDHPGPAVCFLLELDVHASAPGQDAPAQALSVAIRGRVVGRSVVTTRRTLRYRIAGELLQAAGPIRVQLHKVASIVPPPFGDKMRHQPAICFHELKLFKTLGHETDGDLERPRGISRAELARLSGMTAEHFISQFESLGDNCEFGVVQRYCGAEPVGLLRFGAPRLDALLRCLRTGFAKFGAPEHIEIRIDEGGEYLVHETRSGMVYHTWYHVGDVDRERLLSQQIKRIAFLTRKLMEDFAEGTKIFVWKGVDKPVSEQQVGALFDALCDFGENTLLWVVQADSAHPSGTIEIIRPRFLKAYIHRFAPRENVPDFEPEPWLEMCLNAYRIIEATPRSPPGTHRKPGLSAQPIEEMPDEEVPVSTALPVLAHVQNLGDTLADTEGWVGQPGDGLAIEGFAVLEDPALPAQGLRYQALLKDGSLSQTAAVGEYCGSRGRNQPIYGMLFAVDPGIASSLPLTCDAAFTDGSQVADLPAGSLCKASTDAPLAAFRLKLQRPSPVSV